MNDHPRTSILRKPLVDGTSKQKFKDNYTFIMYFETRGAMQLNEYFIDFFYN